MQLVLRLLFLISLSLVCRVLFYIVNSQFFHHVGIREFVFGLRFDASIVAWMGFPMVVLSALMAINIIKPYVLIVLRIYFVSLSFVILCLNFIDIGFYPFVFKRLTADSVGFINNGNDLINLISPLFADFWYLFVSGIACVAVVAWLDVKWLSQKTVWIRWQILYYIVLIPSMVMGARGGWQLKPITLIDASLGILPENTSLVLNTPFTFFTTLFEGTEGEPDIMDPLLADSLYEVRKKIVPLRKKASMKNVVIIIMESFSKEYLEEGYMPFLDSLKNESVYFENAYANGKRSVDAVPAILASIPDLQTNSFIYSSFAGNRINSLPGALKQYNYHSLFFHGGRTGTMSFDKFAALAGIDEYYGAEDYPDQSQFDGTWGIFDEPYFQFMIDKLNHTKPPFFSTFFSLSSHHPFKIPQQHTGKFPKGSLDIHESVGYADYALKQFFEEAKKQSWYKHTLFVLVADHTSLSNSQYYNSSLGMFKIPLLFYAPADASFKGVKSEVAQQCDIFPSVLSYLGTKTPVMSFGTNLFDKKTEKSVLNRSSGVFYYYADSTVFEMTTQGGRGLFLQSDSLKTNNLLNDSLDISDKETMVKARFQVYKNVFSQNRYFLAD